MHLLRNSLFEHLRRALLICRRPASEFDLVDKLVDPVIAVRGNVAIAPRWSVIGYADIGGFGAGSRSTSQFLATGNYKASERLYLSAGYRHLHVDYRSDGRRADVVMSGPLLGATMRF